MAGFRKTGRSDMQLFAEGDLPFVQAVAELSHANPFLPERMEWEQRALGADYVEETLGYWAYTPDQMVRRRANLFRLIERTRTLGESTREKLRVVETGLGGRWDAGELQLYDDLVVYILFYEMFDLWGRRDFTVLERETLDRDAWRRFSPLFEYWFELGNHPFPTRARKVALFELFHQVYRAFFNIFECVIGQSVPAAELRARIWQSIFSHDFRRYRRGLAPTMRQVTTLITGPSGSGKELVAQAIGTSQAIPFDPRQERFAAQSADSYHAINISAFARNLVESELFGHAKGAFTDASGNRIGWLETCGDHGTVLLDEIGELDATSQVKLLRVLQNRQFQRLGETKIREFKGKVIAATNRDLRREIVAGHFREDLYYRLCSDVIETPSLASQVLDNPDVLEQLVPYIVARMAPGETPGLANEVLDWLRANLSADYLWPGNFRELEQCVRNVMICGRYIPNPPPTGQPGGVAGGDLSSGGLSVEVAELAQRIERQELTGEELLQAYCRLVYRRLGSFEQAAKRLQLDRRTVRAKVDGRG
jgi:DNA-binding NtrC family response regulator